MRVKCIKTSFEIPIPIEKPDLNGVVYTEKAIIEACKKADNLPIIVYNSDNTTRVAGVATQVKYETGYILVDGYLNYGGTEEAVLFDDDNKVTSMEIVSIGISK